MSTGNDNSLLLAASELLPEGATPPYGHLDLECQAGSITVLTGDSATATTAWLTTLAGLRPPAHGSIQLNSKEPRSNAPAAGFVDMKTPLVSTFDVRMNVMLPRLYHLDESRAESERAVVRLLEQFGYRGALDETPARLDALQHLQVQLARAVALDPAVVFIDEPFPMEIIACWLEITGHVQSLLRGENRAVIMATRNLVFAKEHADNIVLVDNGRAHAYAGWQSFSDSPDFLEFVERLPFNTGTRHESA